MQTVIIEVKLEIDCEEDEVEHIIQELDYNFSYSKIEVDENNEKILYEKEYIKNTHIIDFDNITKSI